MNDGPLYSLHSLREVTPLVMVLFEKFSKDTELITLSLEILYSVHNREYVAMKMKEPCDLCTK